MLVTDDPAAARFVLTQVAERLRTAGGPRSPGRADRTPSVIAVVGLHAGSGAAEVAEAPHPAPGPAPRRGRRLG